MNALSGTVLVIEPRPWISGAVKSDLSRAGFDVVAEADANRALGSARLRPPLALVIAYPIAGRLWRRLKREPGLRDTPVVALTSGRSRIPAPLLLMPLVRAEAYASTSDLNTPGAVAVAVRTAVARSPLPPPTARERLGEKLWTAASAAAIAGVVLWTIAFASDLANASRRLSPLVGLSLFAAGYVVMDVAGRLGRGERPGLRPMSLFWLVVIAAAVASGALLRSIP